MRAKEALAAGLREIEGVEVFGEPPLWALAYGHGAVDLHAVAAAMNERGWYIGRTTSPKGIHMMCTPVHEPIIDEYLDDLRDYMAVVAGGTHGGPQPARYA